jgi:hypothetical protein
MKSNSVNSIANVCGTLKRTCKLMSASHAFRATLNLVIFHFHLLLKDTKRAAIIASPPLIMRMSGISRGRYRGHYPGRCHGHCLAHYPDRLGQRWK